MPAKVKAFNKKKFLFLNQTYLVDTQENCPNENIYNLHSNKLFI